MPHASGDPSLGGEDPIERIERLHGEALTHVKHYQPDEAAALLAQAARLVQTLPPALAGTPRAQEAMTRIVLAQSWTAFEQAGWSAAEQVLAVATGQAAAMHREDLVALCHMQGATMLGRHGDLPGALARMRSAEAGLDLLPVQQQALLLLNRGTLGCELMELDQARQDLDRAGRLAEGTDPALEFMARHNEGWVEYLRGDLPTALRLMNQADAMTVDVSRGVSNLDRARALLEAGLLTEAAEVLTLALDIAAQDGSGQTLGEIELALARTSLLLGDLDASARWAAQARRRFHSRESGPWRRRAQLVELEADGARRAEPRRTLRLARALAGSARAHGERHVSSEAHLIAADTALQVGDTTEAGAAYRQARDLVHSASLPIRLHARLVGARLAAATSPARSSRILAEAADDLAGAQQGASSLDLRTALAVHASRLALLDFELGFASGSVASLFSRTERWRAVSDRVPLVRPPSDDEAAGLLARLRRITEALRTASEPEDDERAGAEAAALERRLRALDWARSGGDLPPTLPLRPLGYADTLRRVRSRGAVLATYLPYRGDLYAVVLGPGRGRVHRLGTVAEIEHLVARVRADVEAAALPTLGPVRATIDASLRADLARLDRLLLRWPTERSPDVTPPPPERLVVVPNNTITAVPWGMLPSRLGLATTVARSATSWASAPDALVVRPRVAALAGPDLREAPREVRAIGAMYPDATVLEPAQCTTAALRQVASTHDLVHIAAHGRHHYQSPMFSSLRMSDGPAFGYEVPQALIAASHVVLSACEVGRATIRPGDETLGLTALLLSLGVRTVVAAVSKVPDDVAASTMVAYHAALSQGTDAAVALAQAAADGPIIARAFTVFGAPWRAAPELST